MANWGLKVNVNEMGDDRKDGGGVWRGGLLTVIPGALLLLCQLSTFSKPPRTPSPGDIAFVCLGQHFSSGSTWACALLTLAVSSTKTRRRVSPGYERSEDKGRLLCTPLVNISRRWAAGRAGRNNFRTKVSIFFFPDFPCAHLGRKGARRWRSGVGGTIW